MTELGAFRSDGEIAQRRQHVAAADGIALHPGDDGDRHVANGAMDFFDGQTDGAAAFVSAIMFRLIAAGAERPVAGATEHDHPDIPVPPGPAERVGQFVAGPGAKGVVDLGAVDNDPGRALALLIQNIFVRYGIIGHCLLIHA